MMKVLALPFAMLLASCATYQPQPLSSWHMEALGELADPPPSAELASIAKDALHEYASFVDPYSVQIRLTNVVKSYNDFSDGIFSGSSTREIGWFVCGKYNAKNRMGGYTGESWFMILLDSGDQTKAARVSMLDYGDQCESLTGGAMERRPISD